MSVLDTAAPARAARLRKLWRFVTIYGVGRSLYKVAGRLRGGGRLPALRRPARDVAVLGCGQFAFATVGYFVARAFGPRFATCYDVDPDAQRSFARAYGADGSAASADDALAASGLRLAYVLSNHASHTPYAVAALRRGLDVYVEKPIAVTGEQLAALLRAVCETGRRVWSGYNRPFSAAVRRLRRELTIDPAGGISLQCFVSGHKIPHDHWYRRPDEGTRVCGNAGHWIDLAVHVLAWRGLPDRLEIALTAADPREPDDNFTVTFRSDRGDVFGLMLTSRTEPFEGINETVNFQHGETICKIDDFRRMTLWQGARLRTWRFWPKDVGHRLAILQPFAGAGVDARDWEEVVLSTLLTLRIADMVRGREWQTEFSFRDARRALEAAVRGARVVDTTS